jgi:uncharacterized membrane protein
MQMPRQPPSHSRVDDLDVAAPPYRRNPSEWPQRIPIAILATIAAGISVYLALYQWRLIDAVWDPLFGRGSERVLDSQASHAMQRVLGIPDAALGALAYVADGVLCMAGSTRRWQFRPYLVFLFGLVVIPLGIVSIILVVLQGVVIGSWCSLCLLTALISVALIVLAHNEIWATIKYLQRVHRATGSRKKLWATICGRYVAEADAVALLGAREGKPAEHKGAKR